MTMFAFVASVVAMPLLWITIFLFARWGWKVSKVVAFLIGTFLLWPAAAMSFGVLMTESVTEGTEHPVGPAVVYSFAFAAGLTFAIWIVGYAIASIGGWLLPRRRSI